MMHIIYVHGLMFGRRKKRSIESPVVHAVTRLPALNLHGTRPAAVSEYCSHTHNNSD